MYLFLIHFSTFTLYLRVLKGGFIKFAEEVDLISLFKELLNLKLVS